MRRIGKPVQDRHCPRNGEGGISGAFATGAAWPREGAPEPGHVARPPQSGNQPWDNVDPRWAVRAQGRTALPFRSRLPTQRHGAWPDRGTRWKRMSSGGAEERPGDFRQLADTQRGGARGRGARRIPGMGFRPARGQRAARRGLRRAAPHRRAQRAFRRGAGLCRTVGGGSALARGAAGTARRPGRAQAVLALSAIWSRP